MERLFETCKKYILPDDTLVEDGKRNHPFRISARPVSLCASLLWMRLRDLGRAMSIVKFSEKVGVSRSTIIGVNKQLDSSDISKAKRSESKTKKLKAKSRPKAKPQTEAKRSESETKKPKARSQPKAKPQPKRKLDKTRRELNKEIRKTVRQL